FNRSLTVTTDLEPAPVVLQIKGHVGNLEKPAASDFPSAKGNLKFKTSSFNMGRVFRKDEYVVREFPVMNAGTKAIQFLEPFTHPSYITVEVQPRKLEPGEVGSIKVSYNGMLKNQYGFQSDNIELLTDDVMNPRKSFSVFATLEDYFPDITPQELARSPQLSLASTSLDFGMIRRNITTEKEVTFTNTGKQPLELRAIQPNCSCVSASASPTTLKPGESGTITISFNPADRKGTQNKAVTFYSNDPRNPVQRLTFTAYVQ